MAHLYYGDPNEEFSLLLARTLVGFGADILEIGVPYTDPVCDGEVFQRACFRALAGGITPPDVFAGIELLRKKGYHQPMYLTNYYGPIFKIGLDRFLKRASEVGVSGLIVPDILLEEQDELRKYSAKYGLSIIQFATVYSSHERLKKICKASTDFIYCISLPGVTGDKPQDRKKLKKLIEDLRSLTDKKIYVGFGIKSKKDVSEIISYGADGVIVGSAIAKIYEYYINKGRKVESSLDKISTFVKSLRSIRRD